MLCNTCDKTIEDSTWRIQCIDCYKQNYKRCLLCNKKKQNKYIFCYSCNNNKKEECNMKLKSKAEDELYEAYNSNYRYDTKICALCQQVAIPKSLKWKNYCSSCYLFHINTKWMN